MRRLVLVLSCILSLLGCAGPDPFAADRQLASVAAPGALRPYPETGKFLQCVPFARTVSGIELYGDAWTWWDGAAQHRFARGRAPQVGAVLVLRRSAQLPEGHVAVVAQLQEPRRMLVTHANGGADGDTRGVIHERMPIIDVSAANDWSEIRLMNRYGQFGRVYPAYGFIYPPRSDATVARR